MVSLRNVAPVCKSLGFRRGLMPCRSNRMAGDPAAIHHNGSARSVGFCAINTVSQAPVLEAPVLAPSLLRAGFEARALMAHRWSGSGLPGDHGRTSCQARATGRYAANDGAWNVDFECFLGSSGTKPLHRVPLQCHPKQCADKHLRPPTARSDIVAYLAVNLRPLVGALVSAVPALRLDYPKTSQPRRR